MCACDGKTEKSNADVGPAEADFRTNPPGRPRDLVHHRPAVDLGPAYSCPATLALVFLYLKYNVYAPLFYLSLVKHRVNNDGDDDDDRKTMMMLAPELAEGSPFRDMSGADLLEEIRKGLGLLLDGLWERYSELEEELKSLGRRKRFWSIALSVALVVINLTVIVALKAAAITSLIAIAALIASLAVVNLLGIFAMHAVYSLLGVTDDDRESLLESQKAVKVMILGSNLARLLPPLLEQIRARLENLNIERSALRTAVASEHQADQGGGVGQTAAAVHLEREEEEVKKKEVQKGMKRIRKMVHGVEREVKAAAAHFLNIIAE